MTDSIILLNWEHRGYFDDFVISSEEIQSSPDSIWKLIFENAKAGRFEGTIRLVDILKSSVPSPLAMACSDLLGDAGTEDCFKLILQEAQTQINFDLIMEFCNAITQRGRLSDIPVLISIYEKHHEVNDADIFPVWISGLISRGESSLSEPLSFGSIDEYVRAAMDCYKRTADRIGDDQTIVYHGEPLNIIELARYILGRVRDPYLRAGDLRHKFEAMTGIDCSCFFVKENFQPQSASMMLERFLTSPQADQYESGGHYFFGHRIL